MSFILNHSHQSGYGSDFYTPRAEAKLRIACNLSNADDHSDCLAGLAYSAKTAPLGRFVFSANPSRAAAGGAYLTGAIRCWYGVPGHMTYGTEVSGSASFGYWS